MCSDFRHQDPLAGFSVVLTLPKGEVTFHIEREKRQIDVAQSADRSNGYSRLYAAALIQSKKVAKMIKVRSRGFRNKERFANAIYSHLGWD